MEPPSTDARLDIAAENREKNKIRGKRDVYYGNHEQTPIPVRPNGNGQGRGRVRIADGSANHSDSAARRNGTLPVQNPITGHNGTMHSRAESGGKQSAGRSNSGRTSNAARSSVTGTGQINSNVSVVPRPETRRGPLEITSVEPEGTLRPNQPSLQGSTPARNPSVPQPSTRPSTQSAHEERPNRPRSNIATSDADFRNPNSQGVHPSSGPPNTHPVYVFYAVDQPDVAHVASSGFPSWSTPVGYGLNHGGYPPSGIQRAVSGRRTVVMMNGTPDTRAEPKKLWAEWKAERDKGSGV